MGQAIESSHDLALFYYLVILNVILLKKYKAQISLSVKWLQWLSDCDV